MTTSPAGWYPTEDGHLRWWDGARWTEHHRPAETHTSATPGLEPAPTPSTSDSTGLWGRSERSAPAVDEPTCSAKGHNGTISFDGDFITIHRKGVLARLTVGKGDKRFPISSVTSVQWKPPGIAMNGFISFSLGGGNERRSRFGSQTTSAVHDENSIIVTKRQAPQFDRLRGAIEAAIAERGRPVQPFHQTMAPTPGDQIKQLAELYAAGILSDEEFSQKKAELLRRM
jgi:hypothetical protein